MWEARRRIMKKVIIGFICCMLLTVGTQLVVAEEVSDTHDNIKYIDEFLMSEIDSEVIFYKGEWYAATSDMTAIKFDGTKYTNLSDQFFNGTGVFGIRYNEFDDTLLFYGEKIIEFDGRQVVGQIDIPHYVDSFRYYNGYIYITPYLDLNIQEVFQVTNEGGTWKTEELNFYTSDNVEIESVISAHFNQIQYIGNRSYAIVDYVQKNSLGSVDYHYGIFYTDDQVNWYGINQTAHELDDTRYRGLYKYEEKIYMIKNSESVTVYQFDGESDFEQLYSIDADNIVEALDISNQLDVSHYDYYLEYFNSWNTEMPENAFISEIESAYFQEDEDMYYVQYVNGDIYTSRNMMEWQFVGNEDTNKFDYTYIERISGHEGGSSDGDYYLVANDDEPYKIALYDEKEGYEILGSIDIEVNIHASGDEFQAVPTHEKLTSNRHIYYGMEMSCVNLSIVDNGWRLIFRYRNSTLSLVHYYIIESSDLNNWVLVEEYDCPRTYEYKGAAGYSTHFNTVYQLDNGQYYTRGAYGFFAISENLIDWEIKTGVRQQLEVLGENYGIEDIIYDNNTYKLWVMDFGNSSSYKPSEYYCIETNDFENFTVKELFSEAESVYNYEDGVYRVIGNSVVHESNNLTDWKVEEKTFDEDTILYNKNFRLDANAMFKLIKNNDDIIVNYNNEFLEFTVKPTVVDGRTMIPLRDIGSNFGYDIEWVDETQSIILSDGVNNVVMQIDLREVYVNDQLHEIDIPPTLIENRTYVPVRAILEAFDKSVSWDGDLKVITIQ